MKNVRICLGALAVLISTQAACAQEAYPNRLIKLIVPFAAGGNTDVVGRITANYMQKALEVNVVVENRAGAGGISGTDAVAKSAPDGYTLCVCGIGPITVAPATEKLPYEPLKDLAPISLINTNPLVLMVNPNLPAKDPHQLVEYSKRSAKGLHYASAGAGALVQYAAQIFRAKTGANINAVHYRGGALATQAVVTGEVQMSFANMSDAIGQLAAGTVRPLAITTAQRNSDLKDVPTLLELGLVDYAVESWNALFAPAGTPAHIIDRLAVVMEAMARDSAIRKSMSDFGSISVANSPAQFARMLREETEQWNKALAAIGLRK
jgi:tripartite-type tricarboxylate transporter receptor subunit TctC